MGWYHPVDPGSINEVWARPLHWVLYAEPRCPELEAELRRRDDEALKETSALQHLRPPRPSSAEEVQDFTFGQGGVRRFDAEGKRLTGK